MALPIETPDGPLAKHPLRMDSDEGGEAGGDDKTAAGAKKKKMMLIAIVALLVILCGAGAFIFKSKLFKHGKPKPEVPKVGTVLTLDEFMLNLADPTNDHYLKTTIGLGLKEGVTEDKLKDKEPEMKDAILMVLTAKRLDDLRTVDGKETLKKQLRDQVNSALGEDDVVDVYFEAFATQ